MNMRIVLVVLAGCWTSQPVPPAPPKIEPVAKPVVWPELPGRRVVIEHEFLHRPISLRANSEPDVATATESIMITTLRVIGEPRATIMLTSDGKLGDGKLPDLDPTYTIVSAGNDARILWRIEKTPDDKLEFTAENRATGVYCALYEPSYPTMEQIKAAIAHCRDIRVAKPGEESDAN